jgi:hypothetical protein
VYTKAIKNELKGLEEDVKEGFGSLQCAINGLNDQIQSATQEWEGNWERKFGLSASTSNVIPMSFHINVPNVTDECIKTKLESIEGNLASILAALPIPNDDDSIQTPAFDIYSRPWPSWSPQDPGGQLYFPSSVRRLQTLADSLEQAVGTASVILQDKAVDTESITWQDNAVGTASITPEWQDKPVDDKPVDTGSIKVDWRDKAGAVAECLLSAVAERLQRAQAVDLLKDCVVHARTTNAVLVIAVISTILYFICIYTVQEEAVFIYY